MTKEFNNIIPVKLRKIRVKGLKIFEDTIFDFSNKDMICFIGKNGTGKSTILNCISLLFSKFDGYDEQRLKNILGKMVRHVDHYNQDGVYGDSDFEIRGTFLDIQNNSEYDVALTKNGFTQKHPEHIIPHLRNICIFTRLDMELDKFQLHRDHWPQFKKLFTSVTGFEIEEIQNLFTIGSNASSQKELDKYVLNFMVHKPQGKIKHQECSDGERKIIKSFSSLLNKEITPSIILIDNVEMHVETTRHLIMLNSLQECFPSSQIFMTTHSHYISRNLNMKDCVYDTRIVFAGDLIKKQPWRLYLIDEIEDAVAKFQKNKTDTCDNAILTKGDNLKDLCLSDSLQKDELKDRVKTFLKDVSDEFVNNVFLIEPDLNKIK
jgi:ABC-type lipoprotein export system ATPase subunit